MLDLDATVRDHVEAGAGGERGSGLVPDADLLPQALRADRDGLLGDRHDVLAPAEHVDDVDSDLDRRQRRVAPLAEDLVVARIDGDDPVAVLLHVLGGEEARPVPFGRQADDGDRPARSQNAAKGRDVVGHAARGRRTRIAGRVDLTRNARAGSKRLGCVLAVGRGHGGG